MEGYDVRAIRKPTVPEGTERLRITLHSYNSDSQVGFNEDAIVSRHEGIEAGCEVFVCRFWVFAGGAHNSESCTVKLTLILC